MTAYLVLNAFGDLVASFETFRDAQRFLQEVDDEDLKGYSIEIIEDDYEEDVQH